MFLFLLLLLSLPGRAGEIQLESSGRYKGTRERARKRILRVFSLDWGSVLSFIHLVTQVKSQTTFLISEMTLFQCGFRVQGRYVEEL